MQKNLTEFQQRAAGAALDKLLKDPYFSICDLRKIASLIGQTEQLCGRDYEALEALHCVEYAKMGRELSMQVREKCLELLGLPPQIVEPEKAEQSQAQPEPKSKPPNAPQGFLRLAFWR
jgi:hypothetical protein